MQPIFESFLGPLLKSGVGPLARYGNHQETISRRPEQMYTSSDTRLDWPGKGPLFESDSNKRQGAKTGSLFESLPRPLLKSGLHPLFRYGTHQTISGRLERVYLLSDPRLEWPEAGPLFELNLNLGTKCGHYSSHPWAIIYVRSGALGPVRQQCKSLSYVVICLSNLLKIMYLLRLRSLCIETRARMNFRGDVQIFQIS